MVRILSILLFSLALGASGEPVSGYKTEFIFPQTGDFIYSADDTMEVFLAEFSDLAVNHIKSEECKRKYSELSAYLEKEEGKSLAHLATSARYCGFYCNSTGQDMQAIEYYRKSLNYYDKLGQMDSTIVATPLLQLGLVYQELRKFHESIDPFLQSLRVREKAFGEDSPQLLQTLVALSASYISIFKYDMAQSVAERGLGIIEKSKEGLDLECKFMLNVGITYKERGDFDTAELFFNRARNSFFELGGLDPEVLIFIYNSMGVAYSDKGDTLAAIKLYKDAIKYIDKTNYSGLEASSVYTNLAHLYAEQGAFSEAEECYTNGIAYTRFIAGINSYSYIAERENLAFFHNHYLGNVDIASRMYRDLWEGLEDYSHDIDLVIDVGIGYTKVLSNQNKYLKALSVNNMLIERQGEAGSKHKVYMIAGRAGIYYSLFLESDSLIYLEKSLTDFKNALAIVDSLKIDLSADEGRLRVTEKFDYIMSKAVASASTLYSLTEQQKYLKLALEYSERSKASTLLASTRESKAIKFHIPDTLVWSEKDITRRINEYENKLFEERSKLKPDTAIIRNNEVLKLDLILERDNLIELFEEKFPDYYNLKHNKTSIQPNDIVEFIGRRDNFVEYYISDTLLYSFVINRKHRKLFITSIDSAFFCTVQRFRNDIVNPLIANGTHDQFMRISTDGYLLYTLLIEPLQQYFISDRLIIASDDILSYIPFEVLLSAVNDSSVVNYRNIPFLFKQFDMEYVYSASLLIENGKSGRRLANKALVFAPEYSGQMEADSLLLARQSDRRTLVDIPGAKEEAIYISQLLGGELYLSDNASESRFKSQSLDNRVIHLAMHTLLNESNPMFSKMVFAFEEDSKEDGLLNTYELFDLDIDAGMVVLSSCNTGKGDIRSGEGVISLARGFMYAGAPTVVMSLWEVDDYVASEIIKLFYKNLKKGFSKSKSLRLAREKYLSNSSMSRSHPYFWCSLVILGDDEAMYYRPVFYLGSIALLLLLILSVIKMTKFRNPRTP